MKYKNMSPKEQEVIHSLDYLEAEGFIVRIGDRIRLKTPKEIQAEADAIYAVTD